MIKEDYENKLKEFNDFDERELIQKFCLSKLSELFGQDFRLPDSLNTYFKISLSTNNISISFRDQEIDFYNYIELKVDKKNESFDYIIKDYALSNVSSEYIELVYNYISLLTIFLNKINYNFIIDLLDKKLLLKKQSKSLEKELVDLENEYFTYKYNKEINNINTILKPLTEEQIFNYIKEVKNNNMFNFVIKFIKKDKINFKNTIFLYESNIFYIDHKKVSKTIFIDNLRKAFTFDNKIANKLDIIYDKLKLDNNNKDSFDIGVFHQNIIPLIIKEKSEKF